MSGDEQHVLITKQKGRAFERLEDWSDDFVAHTLWQLAAFSPLSATRKAPRRTLGEARLTRPLRLSIFSQATSFI